MKPYQTIKEIAATFGVCRSTIYAWKKQGCPYLNLTPGASRETCRFTVAGVEEWLRTRTAGKGVEA